MLGIVMSQITVQFKWLSYGFMTYRCNFKHEVPEENHSQPLALYLEIALAHPFNLR